MKYFEFADKYFETRQDIYLAIKSLSDKRGLNLFSKLLSDNNEVNFMSWLSEMKFGLRLDKAFQDLSYSKKVGNQTPDWFSNSNGQKLILEVVRINPVEEVLLTKIDDFKICNVQENKTIAGTTYSKTLDSKYFYGNIDKISKKEITYRELIKEKKWPLIICIDSSEIELFTFYNDFHDFFVADGKYGYFNKNILFGKNVSAIFFQVPFDGYQVIINENCDNKINEQNINAIKVMCG